MSGCSQPISSHAPYKGSRAGRLEPGVREVKSQGSRSWERGGEEVVVVGFMVSEQ